MTPRVAQPEDILPTARVWHDAWHETQGPHLPDALKPLRTLTSFEVRTARMGDLLRVAGPVGAPIGLCAIKPGELDQIYITPKARGTGLASKLLEDAEARLAARGDTSAFLICLPENKAAIGFYVHHGWKDTGVHPSELETLEGPFTVSCRVFRKDLVL